MIVQPMISAVGLAMALLALGGCQTTLPPEFEDCRSETDAALAAVGIDPARVQRFTSTPQRVFLHPLSGNSDDRIIGYSNWLRLDGCEGAIVLRFSRFCRLRQVYERGDCVFGPDDAGPAR